LAGADRNDTKGRWIHLFQLVPWPWNDLLPIPLENDAPLIVVLNFRQIACVYSGSEEENEKEYCKDVFHAASGLR
jgi:hypothetical protein